MTRSPLEPKPLVYAHRGDRSRAEDNTLEAFRLAVEAGADGIELDVRRTADGVLIASHNDRLPDLEPFSDLGFETLRAMAPHVPTLREAMDAIPRHVFVNVEIKNAMFDAGYDEGRGIVDQTLEELAMFDTLDRILVTSFDPVSMKRVREIDTAILCGILLEIVPLDAGIEIARDLGLDAVVPHLNYLKDDPVSRINDIGESGLATVAWGVDLRTDVALLCNAGVDAVITDNPTMARSAIDQR